MTPWTVRRLLEWTTEFLNRKQVDSPRLSAELLLGHVRQQRRIGLYTDYQSLVPEEQLEQFRDLVQRASRQEPIAYLTGTAHFFNLELEVGPGVLIPRPDTETLVENVLQMLRREPVGPAPRILDLCTGSGCIAAAVATSLPEAFVAAVDLSPSAVQIAKKNIAKLGLEQRVHVLQGDLYQPLEQLGPPQPFDLILANPPYIAQNQLSQLPATVRDYEPMLALDGGADGLTLHRRILEDAPRHLPPGGRIYLEIAFDQGEAALLMIAQYPQLIGGRILKDYGGKDRVLTAQRAP